MMHRLLQHQSHLLLAHEYPNLQTTQIPLKSFFDKAVLAGCALQLPKKTSKWTVPMSAAPYPIAVATQLFDKAVLAGCALQLPIHKQMDCSYVCSSLSHCCSHSAKISPVLHAFDELLYVSGNSATFLGND